MPINQDLIFAESEGDRWFERNKEGYKHFNPEIDLPTHLIQLYQLKPQKILEIGAANGTRLAYLCEKYHSKGVALEPSLKAIEDGRLKFPFIEFIQGIASSIFIKDAFDLVITNFVFHWMDRQSLFKSITEIDAKVAKGGFLIIGDFLPSYPKKVPYHHLPQEKVYTYKQNYADFFIASGFYQCSALLTSHHTSKTLESQVLNDDRIGVFLLEKRILPGSI